jgi:phosphatidate cytidylyltransferase
MLKTRIITAVIALAAIAVVLFAIPSQYTEIIIGLLLLGGAWEWSGFLETDKPLVRALYVIIVGSALAVVHVADAAQRDIVLLVACAWWVAAFFWTMRFPTPIPAPVRWLCGLLVIVPLFAALTLLLRLGLEYFIFVLLIVWVADGGAYFAGKYLGRVKLAPSISPGKTWEGVIGGLVLVAALALAASTWKGLDISVLLPFCLGVAAISIVGDLTVSMFKRTTGLKDSGSLFPGHGGVLDRIDSIAAAAPWFAVGLVRLGLV